MDAACTRLKEQGTESQGQFNQSWGSLYDWGPTALLPVFQLLGTEYREKQIISHYVDTEKTYDAFTRLNFIYGDATASLLVGKGIKSEGDLVVSGTEGYIYVPAPWWKTDYFELRYENPANNKRYFYQLEGEGIRYEIVAFLKAIENGRDNSYISMEVSKAIAGVMEDFCEKKGVREI